MAPETTDPADPLGAFSKEDRQALYHAGRIYAAIAGNNRALEAGVEIYREEVRDLNARIVKLEAALEAAVRVDTMGNVLARSINTHAGDESPIVELCGCREMAAEFAVRTATFHEAAIAAGVIDDIVVTA